MSEIALIISTAFSLLTSALAASNALTDVFRAAVIFPRKIRLLLHEIEAMRGVVDECYRTIDNGPVEAPQHVKELLITTHEQGEEIGALATRAARVVNGDGGRISLGASRLRTMRFIVSSEKTLASEIAVFRDKVGLLRDACSEIRLRGQLVELSAAMARLTELSLVSSVAGRSASQPHFQGRRRQQDAESASQATAQEGDGQSTEVEAQNNLQVVQVVRDLMRQSLASLASDNYVADATVQLDSSPDRGVVVIEDSSRTGGDRFKYRPARVQLDTGSRVDLVTREYLSNIGFDFTRLQPVPDDQQEVEGPNKVIYTATQRAEIQWYRRGEGRMNTTPFLVVDSGPFDLLLSSYRFAEEAQRAFALSMVRPSRKPADQIREEVKEKKRKLDEAKALQQAALRVAFAARNQEVGRVTTINTVTGQVIPLRDLEHGQVANASSSPPAANGDVVDATGSGGRRRWRIPFWRRNS